MPLRATSFAAFLALSGFSLSAPSAMASPCSDLRPVALTKQQSRPVTAKDLVRLRDVGTGGSSRIGEGALAMSPDRGRIAFQIRRGDPATNTICLGMFVMTLAPGGSLLQIDAGGDFMQSKVTQSGVTDLEFGFPALITPKWSPDGLWIAFLKRTGGTVQVWRARSNGGRSEQLTSSEVGVDDFAWRDDGQSLAFTTRPGLATARRAVDAEANVGFLYDDRFIPARGNRPFHHGAVEPEYFAFDFQLAKVRPASDAERSLVDRGTRRPEILESRTSDAGWRADLIKAPNQELPTYAGNDLRVSREGKGISCPSQICGSGFSGFWWGDAGKALYVMRRDPRILGNTALFRWVPETGSVRLLKSTPDMITDCQQAGEALICLHQASTQPSRIVRVTLSNGTLTSLVDLNPEFLSIQLQPSRRLFWRNDQGVETYGDLVLPPGHQPGQRHPLIVVQYSSRGFLRGGSGDDYPIQLFAAHGNAVLSFSQPVLPYAENKSLNGNARIQAGVAGFVRRRGVDSSLDHGIRLVESLGVVDPERVALTGLSDGATTTLYALLSGRPYRAAAVSSLCDRTGSMTVYGPAHARTVASWGFPKLTDSTGDDFWKKLAITSSPELLRTPLLVQIADDEYTCGLSAFSALKEVNGPAEMYVFPGEHHVKWQPAHRFAVYSRSTQWFDFWLMGREDPDPIDPGQYRRWRELGEKQASSK